MAFTTVTGKVTRTFYDGKGAEIAESFTRKDGKEFTLRWTAWFESAHGLTEGAEVEVSGIHSDEVHQWEDKQGEVRHSVKRSINKARVKGGGSQAQVAPVEPWAADPEGLPF